MSIRYLYNVILASAAAFLIVATQAFANGTTQWLVFGIAGAAAIASALMVALRTGTTQRALSGVALIIAAWTVVASLVFVPATVLWLGFASAIALAVIGLAGLTAHELRTERVVHSLEVPETATPAQTQAHAMA